MPMEEKTMRYDMSYMKEIQVTPEDVRKTMTRLCHWIVLGINKIHNFWSKKLTCVHGSLEIQIQEAIPRPGSNPRYFTLGITYMLSKGEKESYNYLGIQQGLYINTNENKEIILQ